MQIKYLTDQYADGVDSDHHQQHKCGQVAETHPGLMVDKVWTTTKLFDCGALMVQSVAPIT